MRAVNLLPEQYRRRVPTGQTGGAYVALGVLLVILVGAALYILADNQVKDREAELAKLQNQAAVAQAEAASLAGFGDFAQIKNTRVNSVRALAAQRFDFERLVRELAHVLPSGSWVSTFSATAKPESSTPGAAGGPTMQITGCAPSPSSVATVMVRLRKMHRVEDVSLSASARPGAETTTGCGTTRGRPNYNYTITVTFSAVPTASDIVATDKVPASLGGGQ